MTEFEQLLVDEAWNIFKENAIHSCNKTNGIVKLCKRDLDNNGLESD